MKYSYLKTLLSIALILMNTGIGVNQTPCLAASRAHVNDSKQSEEEMLAREQNSINGQGSANAMPAQLPMPTNAQIEKIKIEVQKLGVARRVTVIFNDGAERYGSISEINTQDFQIIDVDAKQRVAIAYDEVKNVRNRYGDKNRFTGKRSEPKKEFIKGVVVVGAVIGGLLALVAFGLRD